MYHYYSLLYHVRTYFPAATGVRSGTAASHRESKLAPSVSGSSPSLRLAQSKSCMRCREMTELNLAPVQSARDWTGASFGQPELAPLQTPAHWTGASAGSFCRQVPLLSSGPGLADPAAQQRPLSWVSVTSLSSRQLAAAVAGSSTAASHRRRK